MFRRCMQSSLTCVFTHRQSFQTVSRLLSSQTPVQPLDNAHELLKKYPRVDDNRIEVKIPGLNLNANSNPYASNASESESDNKPYIAAPIKKKSPVKQDPPATQNNIGTIGRFDGENEVDRFDGNRVMFSGFQPDRISIQQMSFRSSVIALPDMVFSWSPRSWSEVTAESLSLLNFLYPPPDLLLFGCGLDVKPVDPSVHHLLKTLNIPYELLASSTAMGTFNLLNEDRRKVAICIVALNHDEHHEYERRNMTRFNKK